MFAPVFFLLNIVTQVQYIYTGYDSEYMEFVQSFHCWFTTKQLVMLICNMLDLMKVYDILIQMYCKNIHTQSSALEFMKIVMNTMFTFGLEMKRRWFLFNHQKRNKLLITIVWRIVIPMRNIISMQKFPNVTDFLVTNGLWHREVVNIGRYIERMYSVAPNYSNRFYLCMLLLHV